MAKLIFVLNGPNLNMLGKREPGIYGGKTLDEIGEDCRKTAGSLGLEVEFRQTNHEGVLVDWIQEAGDKAAGMIINPGAYTHTSIALHDAIKSIAVPVIEVHLSDPKSRESFRHISYIGMAAVAHFAGHGANSYTLALDAAARL